jgi:hypothetical protein
MVIRDNASWLLAAVILGGTVLSGCHYASRRCADLQPSRCNCGSDASQWGADPANSSFVTPGPPVTESPGPVPSPVGTGRVPLPQSRDIVEYREPSLFDRVKFRLQRLNPLARRETPVIEYSSPQQAAPGVPPAPASNLPYTPAPPVDESTDRRTTSHDERQTGFEPARIDTGTRLRTAVPLVAASVDAWPYAAADSGGAPRILTDNAPPVSMTPVQRVPVRNFK